MLAVPVPSWYTMPMPGAHEAPGSFMIGVGKLQYGVAPRR